MATINSIYYVSQGKQLFIDNSTNQFVISGYRLSVDPNLNRDLLIVQAPNTTGDIGEKGNIAFDNHHIYYCVNTNKWVRSRLADWTSDFISPEGSLIRVPTNWWRLTSNGGDLLANYNFSTQGRSINFDSTNGFTNPAAGSCLLNYSAHIVEPSVLNENFSISFEVKQLNQGFLMGNAFGKLGFYFEFTDPNGFNDFGVHGNSMGPYLGFALSTRNGSVRAVSSTQISFSVFTQVVAINDAASKIIKLYINGTLQASTSYAGVTLGTRYNNPANYGWGIGASPNGSRDGNPVNSTERGNSVNVRYLGFWKGIALNETEISYLYNGGSFRRYPFV